MSGGKQPSHARRAASSRARGRDITATYPTPDAADASAAPCPWGCYRCGVPRTPPHGFPLLLLQLQQHTALPVVRYLRVACCVGVRLQRLQHLGVGLTVGQPDLNLHLCAKSACRHMCVCVCVRTRVGGGL